MKSIVMTSPKLNQAGGRNAAIISTAFLVYFLADILFLPYFLPLPAPSAVLIVPFWLFALLGNIEGRTLILGAIGIAMTLVSYILGLYYVVPNSELYLDRLVSTGVILFMFATYMLSEAAAKGKIAIIERILAAYLIFSTAFSLVFFASPNLYFLLREQWTFNQEDMFVSNLTILVRYTGILSDPNNMAVSIVAIAATLIFHRPTKLLQNFSIFAMASLIVIATMSVTGMICLAFLAGSYLVITRFTGQLGFDVLVRIIALAGLLVSAGIVYLLIKDQLIFQLSLERFAANDVDSRLSRWLIVFDGNKIGESIWFGDGGSIFWMGRDYRPHNGHLYVLFAFGILPYLCFAFLFFRFSKAGSLAQYVPIAILIIGFTINVGVYEHRFAGIWVVLMTFYIESVRSKSLQKEITRQSQILPG